MQRQEINLYKNFEAPLPVSTTLSWKKLWLSYAAMAGVLLMMYVISLFHIQYLSVEKNKAMKQVSILQNKFIKIKNSFPPTFFSQNIGQSITQLQKELTTQENILETIVNRTPFSKILTAFSNTIAPNVWLSGIIISKGGDDIALKGQSLSMDSLQTFLNNLLHEPLFSDYALNLKNVENTSKADANQILTFEMSIVKKTS